ncbi:MAG: sn-glycerol-3-phosphate ABC transporter ATP-binding protein UgpC [Anaerolineales bacterium]
MPELRLSHVTKTYPGGVQAVSDFNIEIEHGEFVVLVGPSGCGKTTVLRMIAGLESITTGDLYLADERINDKAPADRDISMVFQTYALYGHMSVYQNLGFGPTIRHEDSDVAHEKVMEAAEIVELKSQLNRFPRNLSGGQRQRVALGRSIVNHAKIVLMDEPLSNLDAKLRVQARRELIKLHQKLGNTFVYVTHDQTEAMTMADRIVVMNSGRVQQIGDPRSIYRWPENLFVAGFIGNPPMNLVQGCIADGKFVAPGMNVKIPQEILDRIGKHLKGDITMGIRPEHFSMEPDKSSQKITAAVSAREFLGGHTLAYLQLVGTELTANIKQNITQPLGDSIDVYMDMNHVHFFDPESERRIQLEGVRQ